MLAGSVLSRMRSLPTSFTLALNMVSKGAPTRLRPPAWSSRANSACRGGQGRGGQHVGMCGQCGTHPGAGMVGMVHTNIQPKAAVSAEVHSFQS